MKKELIEKAYQEKSIAKRQRDTMLRHAEHHGPAHIRRMIELLAKGKSFSEAHKLAMQSIGT